MGEYIQLKVWMATTYTRTTRASMLSVAWNRMAHLHCWGMISLLTVWRLTATRPPEGSYSPAVQEFLLSLTPPYFNLRRVERLQPQPARIFYYSTLSTRKDGDWDRRFSACAFYKHFAYAWLRVFSAPKQSPRPPQRHSPQGKSANANRWAAEEIIHRQFNSFNSFVDTLRQTWNRQFRFLIKLYPSFCSFL